MVIYKANIWRRCNLATFTPSFDTILDKKGNSNVLRDIKMNEAGNNTFINAFSAAISYRGNQIGNNR